MSKDVQTDIEAALKGAAESTSEEESSAELAGEESNDEKSETQDKAPKGKNANTRIQQLIAQEKELQDKLSKVNSTLAERDAELAKLVDLLQARDNDAQVVAKINELYHNSEHKPIIEYLDKLVKGEDVNEKPSFSSKAVEKSVEQNADLIRQLEEKGREINEAISDQQAELIFQQADQYASRLLSELPKEYGEEDKKILSAVIIDKVDWDAIEAENGRNLQEELTKGFKETVDWYGKPKGLIVETKETEKEIDPEEETKKLRGFINQDWGQMKTVEKGGKKVFEPSVSDADFAKALGQILKRQNSSLR